METIHIIGAVIFGFLFLLCIIGPVWSHLEEKNNQNNKTSKGCFNFIVATVIVLVIFAIMGMCSRKGGEWEPRHTQLQKPTQNNVKSITFVSKALS